MYGASALDPITGLPIVPTLVGFRFDNLGPGSAEETFDFLTATPGTKFKTDFEPSFDVSFGHIRGLERERAIHVLSKLRDLIEHILLRFKFKFFP